MVAAGKNITNETGADGSQTQFKGWYGLLVS